MTVSARNYVIAIASAAVIAVSLSACGGGGGPRNGPPPITYVDVDLTGLMSGYSTPEGNFTIRAGQHVDRGDVRYQCAAGGEGCTVMVAVDGSTTTAMYRSSGGVVTAVDVPPPGKEDVNLSDVTVGFWANATMMLEIKVGESETHGDIRFSCATGGDDCTVMVMVANDGTITAMSSGGEVTASDAGDPNTLRDQRLDTAIKAGHGSNWPSLQTSGAPPANSGYVAKTAADVAAIDGWTPMVHELETPAMGMNPAMTDTLVVYSNTDFEIPVDFADEHALNTNPDSNNVYQSLIVNSGNIDQASDVTNFPMTPNSTTNIPMNVGGTGLEGQFDGADGEYWCDTVGGCDVSTDGDGNLNAVTGDLYFTPADGATVDRPDPDYMYFGYWLRESEDGNGDPEFEAAGMYWGAAPSPMNYVQMLEGSATYEGSATGLYVRRWTDANNQVLRRRTGQFTADAALNANFGGAGIAAADHYSISGTIDNFMTGGRAIDPSWRLALQRADFGSGTTLGPYNDFIGVAQHVDANGDPISGSVSDGRWSGRFFGNVEVDNDPVEPGNQSTLPSGVAGDLVGHFNNGDVIGAFGAERQEE